MLYIIPHIIEYVFKKSYGKHHIQVNNVIKTLHNGSSEKYLNETLDTSWSKYTKFNHNNCPFDSNEFISGSKDIRDVNSHM